MNKKFIYTSICCLGLTGGLSSCGEDRSGEYLCPHRQQNMDL